jgi:hypothetical protein
MSAIDIKFKAFGGAYTQPRLSRLIMQREGAPKNSVQISSAVCAGLNGRGEDNPFRSCVPGQEVDLRITCASPCQQRDTKADEESDQSGSMPSS